MEWNDYVSIVLLIFGAFLALTGAIGVLRMPDFYSRLHPAGKSDTLGQFLILIGLGFQLIDGSGSFVTDYAAGPGMAAIKLLLIIIVVFVTAPTATHAITKAAYLDGLKPWTGEEADNAEADSAAPAAEEVSASEDGQEAGDSA